MNYYVYILESEKDGSYYKGFSTDPKLRLIQHNNGETVSTRHLVPWKLVYVEMMATKSEALIRERNLKKATRERIQALLLHSKNIYKDFI